MKRRAFADGSPEPTTTFNDKIETLKEASPGLMPRSRVAILKGYLDEALKDGEITQEQHTQMLMPYFGEVGEKVTEQIAVSDRENFAIGGGNFYGTDLGTREGFAGVKQFTSGKNKDKYYVRYRDKEFGKRKSGTGFNEGNKIFDTKEEADVFYNERQANLGKLKSSGQKTKILNQTEEINNFVNNFFDVSCPIGVRVSVIVCFVNYYKAKVFGILMVSKNIWFLLLPHQQKVQYGSKNGDSSST